MHCPVEKFQVRIFLVLLLPAYPPTSWRLLLTIQMPHGFLQTIVQRHLSTTRSHAMLPQWWLLPSRISCVPTQAWFYNCWSGAQHVFLGNDILSHHNSLMMWHFAQQKLLMDEMMNSPWWEKTTAELLESSGKKYYFVPRGVSDSPRCQLKDMHSLLQQCHGAENRNQEWCVNTQLLVTSCIHLWPDFYLTLRCTHSFLWMQPFKLRTITAPPCVSLAGSWWCSSGTRIFNSNHHMQHYLTWPLPPQNPSLPQSSLCLATSYSALSSWLTYHFRVI